MLMTWNIFYVHFISEHLGSWLFWELYSFLPKLGICVFPSVMESSCLMNVEFAKFFLHPLAFLFFFNISVYHELENLNVNKFYFTISLFWYLKVFDLQFLNYLPLFLKTMCPYLVVQAYAYIVCITSLTGTEMFFTYSRSHSRVIYITFFL